MRFITFVFVMLSVVAAGAVHAQDALDEVTRSAEISLSDEAGEVRYRGPTSIGGRDDAEISYAAFLSEDRDIVGSASLMFGTDLDLGPFQVRLGPHAYAALLDEENEDVFALAIGATVRYDLVRSRGIAIVGSANWSPDILTFGTADNLSDFMARAQMRLADRLIGFVGYRWFRLDLTMRDRKTLQNEIFAGIQWQLEN